MALVKRFQTICCKRAGSASMRTISSSQENRSSTPAACAASLTLSIVALTMGYGSTVSITSRTLPKVIPA